MTERTINEMRTQLRVELKTLRELERRADRAERKYEQNPEDEKAEQAFDTAYKLQQICMNTCISLLGKMTGGKIDAQTARKMLVTQRDKIEGIV